MLPKFESNRLPEEEIKKRLLWTLPASASHVRPMASKIVARRSEGIGKKKQKYPSTGSKSNSIDGTN